MRFLVPLFVIAAFAASSFAGDAKASASAHTAKPMPVANGPVTFYAPCPSGACPPRVAIVQTVEPMLAHVVAAPVIVTGRFLDFLKHLFPHRSVARSRAVTRER